MTERQRRTPRQARRNTTIEGDPRRATFNFSGRRDRAPDHRTTSPSGAGVSIGTLYQYFGSKQDILAAIAQRRASAVRDAIAETVIERPELGSMRTIVRALMHGFDASPATRQVLFDALFHQGGGDAVLARHHYRPSWPPSPARRAWMSS